MRYIRFIFGICALSPIMATTAFGHSLEYRAGRAVAHIDYCGKYDLNRALYNKYGNSQDYETGKDDTEISAGAGSSHEENSLDCGELEGFVKALLNPSAPAANINKEPAAEAKLGTMSPSFGAGDAWMLKFECFGTWSDKSFEIKNINNIQSNITYNFPQYFR